YWFGVHQCSHPRIWTSQEERLFEEISRRLADALTMLLMFRNLRDSEARLERAQRIAHIGYWDRDLDTDRITWSDEAYRIFGLAPQERKITYAELSELIHPEDRAVVTNATVATLTWRRASSPPSQGSPTMGRRLRHPTTALAPWIISRRM